MLREEKNDLEMECEENIRTIEERHAKQIADLEAGFQHKMIVEVSKYQKISTERDAKHKAWEAEYTELLEKQAKELEDAQRRFTEQKHLDGLQRQRILGEKDLSQRVHRETLYQLEQDADREIEELKEQYEERLANELDDKVRLRGQAGIHRKHHEDLKRGWIFGVAISIFRLCQVGRYGKALQSCAITAQCSRAFCRDALPYFCGAMPHGRCPRTCLRGFPQ